MHLLTSTATNWKVKRELFLLKFKITGIQFTGIHPNYNNSPELQEFTKSGFRY